MTSRQPADPILSPAAAAHTAADPALPERTRRHVTRRLIPYLMFIYLLAYLDRANVGVAKLQMQKDLNFTDAIVGFGAGIFFLGYLLLDIPGSLIVERWSARKWLAGIMICWGVVASLMGLLATPLFDGVRPVTQFYALRLALGIAEAGFFPGVIVYLSHWFRFEDRSRAKAWFMVTQPVAVAVGIPLSRWILESGGWAGLAGWRWVFILEGVPPVLMGFVTLWYLTDRPHEARWLPADEKQWLLGELSAEESHKTSAGRVRATAALRHRQTFLLIAVFFLIVTGNQALIFFLPSITENMKQLCRSVLRTAWPRALPYACSAVGILLNGMWAHRTGELRWHTAVPMLATGVSLALAVLAGDRVWLTMGDVLPRGLHLAGVSCPPSLRCPPPSWENRRRLRPWD